METHLKGPFLNRNIFLIGPGGVGKTTVGRLLAPMLSGSFIDLDEEFCARVRPIRRYLNEHGYPAYIRENAALLEKLLRESAQTPLVVFALSSGFLVTDVEPKIVLRNREIVQANGRSVLLLPSRDFVQSARIIVERQIQRGLNLERESQTILIQSRIGPYSELGHIKVFSSASPQSIAKEIAMRLTSEAE